MTLPRWHEFVDNYPYIEWINLLRWVNLNFMPFVMLLPNRILPFSIAESKPSDEIFAHLLTAKTKVVVVDVQTLPRLKLCGATLLAKIVHSFLSELNSKVFFLDRFDNSSVLVLETPVKLANLVTNRVSYVLDTIGIDNSNPANLASRCMIAKELLNCNILCKDRTWLSCPRPECQNQRSSHSLKHVRYS